MALAKTTLQRVDLESRAAIEEMSQALGVAGIRIVRLSLYCLYQKIRGLEHALLPGQRAPVIPEWDKIDNEKV